MEMTKKFRLQKNGSYANEWKLPKNTYTLLSLNFLSSQPSRCWVCQHSVSFQPITHLLIFLLLLESFRLDCEQESVVWQIPCKCRCAMWNCTKYISLYSMKKARNQLQFVLNTSTNNFGRIQFVFVPKKSVKVCKFGWDMHMHSFLSFCIQNLDYTKFCRRQPI
jgi:hypothetical protein